MQNPSYQRLSIVCAASLLFVLSGTGCSLKKLTVNQTAEILEDSGKAFDGETDLELAAIAIPASLKTVEGFLAAHPEQPILLKILAQSYMSYAFGFVEEEAEVVEEDDPDRADHLRRRAANFYERAFGYAMRLLAMELPELAAALESNTMPTEAQLLTIDQDTLPAVFWVANPWLGLINIRQDDPMVLGQMPIAIALLERCVAVDPGYFHAGGLMALGAATAGVPAALGGQADKAKAYFDRAIEMTGGAHLMTRVLYARSVGLQTADKGFYTTGLESVLAADPDARVEFRLVNRLAQVRARRYLAEADELFLD